MQQFVKAIITAQSAKGAGSKQAKADAIATFNNDGKRLVMEAMSPYRVFGIKKFDTPTEFTEVDADVELFYTLLDDLHERNITGHTAKNEVESVLGQYTQETSRILQMVLLKDLKAGFSSETVNKTLCGNKRPLPHENPVIPWYSCMLAEKMPTKKDKKTGKKIHLFNDWPTADKPKIIEAKYDGTRNNAFVDHGSVHQTAAIMHRARSGKPSNHIDGLFDEELQRLEEIIGEPFILDGETMGADWNATMNAKRSSDTKAKNALRYYAFDIILMDTWLSEGTTPNQLERSEFLERVLKEAKCEKIIKTKSRMVYSREEAEEFYEEMLAEGFEGAIFKDPNAQYIWDRDKAWTKWKPVDDFDGCIVSFYPGRKGTRLEHTLGGCVIEGVDENGAKFTCRVGGGWSDKLRNEIWNNKEKYENKMIEIEADPNVSVIPGREINSLRWGQFKKFRPDKD